MYAETAYLHFQADVLQTKFSYFKRDIEKYKSEITELLREEKECIVRLLAILAERPAVGYETSNHYFYNESNLTEKILNIEKIKELMELKD